MFTPVSSHRSWSRPILLILFMVSCSIHSAFAQSLKIEPEKIQAGKTRDVTITVDTGDLDKYEPRLPPASTGLSFETVNGKTFELSSDKKSMVIRMKASQDADLGKFPITLVKEAVPPATQDDILIVVFEVSEFRPRRLDRGPTPDDITEVDAMWNALPYKVVKTNYGRRAADQFYAIQVIIGNNSGYDLQIAGVGFETALGLHGKQAFDDKGKPILDSQNRPLAYALNSHGHNLTVKGKAQLVPLRTFHTPTTDHRLVRGTIEMDQNYGSRARALNFLSGFGTLFSGFIPFYRNANPKANFSTFSSLISGNLREGFGLAAPDLTISQLNRLETTVMHEGLTVPNNSHVSTIVFFPRHIVVLNDTERKAIDKGQMAFLMDKLGSLIIVGKPIISFRNREIVAERADRPPSETTAPAVAPSIGSVSPRDLNNDGILDVVEITGLNLSTANNVLFGGVSGRIRPGGTDTNITVDIPKDAISGDLAVETPGGRAIASGRFVGMPAITDFTPESGPQGTPIVITGRNLADVDEVRFGGVAVSSGDITHDSPTQITVKAPAQALTGKISVKTSGRPQSESTKIFKAAPQIVSISPPRGGEETKITINGINLSGVTEVLVGGVKAITVEEDADPQNRGKRIIVTVPPSAGSGPIQVTTAVAPATSTETFTFIPPPVVQSLSAVTASINTPVDITGTNLGEASEVSVGNVKATIVGQSTPTKITITVPAAASGAIAVTTLGGTKTFSDKVLTITAP